jgi:1,2-diacylglycerol 3-beta-glucosyltransferase
MGTVLDALILLLVAWGCVQFALVYFYGYRSPGSAKLRRPWWWRLRRSDDYSVFFLIACLNEEEVIGGTVRAALDECPDATVVVVDDASDDATSAVARRAGRDRLLLCRRELPVARTGKGAALNVGYAAILADVGRRRLDPDRVLVVVMDADGRLSPGAVGHVIDAFADPDVGGVQLGVRIRNRETLLGQLQDFEFWGIAALAQVARISSHSVSLGGNGQFTRLSALLPLGDSPWSDALTEDLDLAVSLLAAGWRLSSSPDAHVTQQGLEQLRPLIRQRTRWFQGHIACTRRIPELWRSNALPGVGFAEVTSYLLAPLVLVLPWSILFTWGAVEMVRFAVADPHGVVGGSTVPQRFGLLVAWYLLSFAPMLLGAFAYHRRSDAGLVRSIALAHLAVVGSYVTFIATWRALGRILLRRGGWVKTSRHREALSGSPEPPALAVASREAA